MKPYYQDEAVTIYHGDCREVDVGLVDAVVTSPPYAEQRAGLYDGVPEGFYPRFTADWMRSVSLAEKGSVLINIREHVKDGSLSDYVHRTRMLLRRIGWVEVDELIWVKPDGMPVGHPGRPRRSWERILWFAQDNQPHAYPKHYGRPSSRIGCLGSGAASSWLSGESAALTEGVSRTPDYVSVSVRDRPDGIKHPAVFPPKVAEWMIALVTTENKTVLDPFAGSGTTLRSAKNMGRKAIGIEIEERYCEIAAERCRQEVLPL